MIQQAAKDLRKRRAAPQPAAPRPAVSVAPTSSAKVTKTRPKQADVRTKVDRPPTFRARISSFERRRVGSLMRAVSSHRPTAAQLAEMRELMRKYESEPVGSSQRALALSRVQRAVIAMVKPAAGPKAPPKGIAAPAPTAAPLVETPTPEPPVATPTAAPVETPTPTASPEPTATPTVPAAG